LDAVGGVGLGVELPSDDVLEQLASGDAEIKKKIIFSNTLAYRTIKLSVKGFAGSTVRS
jgi:hypothetical protein